MGLYFILLSRKNYQSTKLIFQCLFVIFEHLPTHLSRWVSLIHFLLDCVFLVTSLSPTLYTFTSLFVSMSPK